MKLPTLITKYLFGWGMLTGALLVFIFTSATNQPITANITDEALSIRSNGVIKTQLEEIQRLRTLLRSEQTESTTAAEVNAVNTTVQTTTNARSCTTHNDCPAINMVCQAGTCQTLQNPSCACMQGTAGKYILCVEDDGASMAARTVSCGTYDCIEDPLPRCVSQ